MPLARLPTPILMTRLESRRPRRACSPIHSSTRRANRTPKRIFITTAPDILIRPQDDFYQRTWCASMAGLVSTRTFQIRPSTSLTHLVWTNANGTTARTTIPIRGSGVLTKGNSVRGIPLGTCPTDLVLPLHMETPQADLLTRT